MHVVIAVNHTTLAVRELEQSFHFYSGVLGLRPGARWDKGAYLLAGTDWVCLNLDPKRSSASSSDCTHLALSVHSDQFEFMVDRLRTAGVISWQENRSLGDSFYFLDPNGHKLEIHVSGLEARIEALKRPSVRFDLVLRIM